MRLKQDGKGQWSWASPDLGLCLGFTGDPHAQSLLRAWSFQPMTKYGLSLESIPADHLAVIPHPSRR
jgi:hypothetical protein